MAMELEHFTLNRGTRLQGHGHNTLHICMVQSGDFVEVIGGVEKNCGRGAVRISPSNTIHDLFVGSEGVAGTIIEFSDRLTHGLATLPKSLLFYTDDNLRRVSESIVAAWEAEDKFMAEDAALELAARAVNSKLDKAVPHWLGEFKEELRSDTCRVYSLAVSAERVNRHRSHLARSFRTWYGRSPGAYLRAYRLSLAKQILRTTEQPIAQVALEFGFTDQAHFSKAFRHEFGTTPLSYRKLTHQV